MLKTARVGIVILRTSLSTLTENHRRPRQSPDSRRIPSRTLYPPGARSRFSVSAEPLAGHGRSRSGLTFNANVNFRRLFFQDPDINLRPPRRRFGVYLALVYKLGHVAIIAERLLSLLRFRPNGGGKRCNI